MNEQEVRATGSMPGLEMIYNFLLSLRFKVIKLSTYNSLNNQLKLKDTIIVQKEKDLKKYISIMNNNSDTIFHLNKQIEELKIQKELFYISNCSYIKELDKYKGKRDDKGRFIKKEVNEEV